MSVSIFLWGCAVLLLKDSVKITQIAVSDCFSDLVHMKIGMRQIIGRLCQTLFLKQFLKGFPRPVLDLPAEPVQVIVQRIGNFRQTGAAVVFLNAA